MKANIVVQEMICGLQGPASTRPKEKAGSGMSTELRPGSWRLSSSELKMTCKWDVPVRSGAKPVNLPDTVEKVLAQHLDGNRGWRANSGEAISELR